MLPAGDRRRLRYVPLEQADYMISHYRYHPAEFPPEGELFTVRVDGARLCVLRKLEPVQSLQTEFSTASEPITKTGTDRSVRPGVSATPDDVGSERATVGLHRPDSDLSRRIPAAR